jgi:cytochrome c oxidase assembly protein subunit 15
VVAGGMVAGLKAGFYYNTFPLMDGQFIPDDYAMLKPFYLNFFENVTADQFNHRLLAEMTVLGAAALWWYARGFELSAQARLAFNLLLGMAVLQVSLGIATLVLIIPTWLAVTHQGGAMLLFTLALFTNHALRES